MPVAAGAGGSGSAGFLNKNKNKPPNAKKKSGWTALPETTDGDDGWGSPAPAPGPAAAAAAAPSKAKPTTPKGKTKGNYPRLLRDSSHHDSIYVARTGD